MRAILRWGVLGLAMLALGCGDDGGGVQPSASIDPSGPISLGLGESVVVTWKGDLFGSGEVSWNSSDPSVVTSPDEQTAALQSGDTDKSFTFFCEREGNAVITIAWNLVNVDFPDGIPDADTLTITCGDPVQEGPVSLSAVGSSFDAVTRELVITGTLTASEEIAYKWATFEVSMPAAEAQPAYLEPTVEDGPFSGAFGEWRLDSFGPDGFVALAENLSDNQGAGTTLPAGDSNFTLRFPFFRRGAVDVTIRPKEVKLGTSNGGLLVNAGHAKATVVSVPTPPTPMTSTIHPASPTSFDPNNGRPPILDFVLNGTVGTTCSELVFDNLSQVRTASFASCRADLVDSGGGETLINVGSLTFFNFSGLTLDGQDQHIRLSCDSVATPRGLQGLAVAAKCDVDTPLTFLRSAQGGTPIVPTVLPGSVVNFVPPSTAHLGDPMPFLIETDTDLNTLQGTKVHVRAEGYTLDRKSITPTCVTGQTKAFACSFSIDPPTNRVEQVYTDADVEVCVGEGSAGSPVEDNSLGCVTASRTPLN